jgi:hypothetical protein
MAFDPISMAASFTGNGCLSPQIKHYDFLITTRLLFFALLIQKDRGTGPDEVLATLPITWC